MAHRFGPRKGPRKERPAEPAEGRPGKDLLGKDLLGESLLGKDLLGEGLLGKDLPALGQDADKGSEPARDKGTLRRALPRKPLAQRELPSGGADIPWLYIIAGSIILIGLAGGLMVGYVNSQVKGYTPEVQVEEPTRLDWVFAATGEGGEPPPLWSFFDTKRLSQYEFYLPPTYQAEGDQRYPLILFLSPTEKPVGWGRWKQVCQDREILFAGVRESGRGKPQWQQVRIALDVLDDVRRRYRIDSDRCYVVGLGESGRLACQLAFALPEFFGGVVAIDGATFLPEKTWLRHRVADRLSVALVTGAANEDSALIEMLYGPYFEQTVERSKVWVLPGQGDSVPPSSDLEIIYAWLEEGLRDRQALAQRYPASRWQDAPPSGQAWSKQMLDEAKDRLADPKTQYSGVIQLRGIARRWEGLPAAAEAGRLYLDKYIGRDDWPKEEKADLLQHDLTAARKITAYLTQLPPAVFDRNWQRNIELTGHARNLWKQAEILSPDLADESKKSQDELDKLFNRSLVP